jgi:signal transduction histidine kinase
VILGVVDHHEQQRVAEDELKERAKSMVENLAYSSRLAVLTEDKLLLESALQSVTGAADFAYVSIYGGSWTPLISAGTNKIDLETEIPEIKNDQLDRLKRKLEIISRNTTIANSQYLEYLAPITSAQASLPYELLFSPNRPSESDDQKQSQTIGAVRLGLSMNRVNAQLTSFLKWRGWLLVTFLCLSAIAIYAFSVQITRPVKELTEQARRMSHGQLDQKIMVKSRDEIGQLAATFNDMATSLHELYSNLERKVFERTEELTSANQRLVEISAHKSQFLANVNHELRTPVSAIIGYANLLMRETRGRLTSLQTENLQDLLNNARRQLALIDSLLDFARIEAGKMDVKWETVSVPEVVQAAASTIAPSLDGGPIRLVQELSPGLPTLHTDREKLRQILLNLVDNAVKFTERGEIKISAAQHNGTLRLAVSDTGIGIAEGDVTHLFEEFYRGKTAARGTGLGLAIVKKLVNVLGGEIAVESELGKGSTFTVTLPVKA